MVRYNPKKDGWNVYELPEPFAYDRRTYIDTTTHRNLHSRNGGEVIGDF